jgi:hypothetical protein
MIGVADTEGGCSRADRAVDGGGGRGVMTAVGAGGAGGSGGVRDTCDGDEASTSGLRANRVFRRPEGAGDKVSTTSGTGAIGFRVGVGVWRCCGG